MGSPCGVVGIGAVSKAAPPATSSVVGEGGVATKEPPLMRRVGSEGKWWDMCDVTTVWANDPLRGVKALMS